MGIVRENINFQRNLDPKQAMDLGLTGKWMSLKKDDILIIKKNFATDFNNHIDDNAKYHLFKKGDSFEVNIEPNKYSDGTIGFTGYVSNNIVKSSDDLFIWGTPLELDQRLEILQGLREAQEFQRGLDPKRSMKIGEEALIDQIDWDVNVRHTDFNRPTEIIKFIRNYHGYPIVIVKFYHEVSKKDVYIGVSTSGLGRTKFCSSPEVAEFNIKRTIQRNRIKNQVKNESLDFERGLDPKDTMKIGRVGERDIKKVLDRLVEIRGGSYEINYIKDWGSRTPFTEGTYVMGPGYDKVFRADNLFIRYYPAQGTSADYFTYGYRIEGKVMLEKILTTAEEGLTAILKHITPLPHG
jgi:hypothetical protein